MNKQLKISIITGTLNRGGFIEKNIQSVLNQNYDNFEHIIIDGGSSDNTLTVLNKYPHLKWMSEPDKGQADAFNKGLAIATGDIIGWLDSDDYYLPDIFSKIANSFLEHDDIRWVVSDIFDERNSSNKRKRVQVGEINYYNLLRNPDIVVQQGAFYRKEILDKVKGCEIDLYMIQDFELWLKLSKISTPAKLNMVSAVFVRHDTQKSTYKNSLIQINEIYRVLRKEKISKYLLFKVLMRKYCILIKQLIKIVLIRLKLLDKKYLFLAVRNNYQ